MIAIRRFVVAISIQPTLLVAGVICLLAGLSLPSSSQAASSIDVGKVVCLSTHWYPEPQRQPDQIENPLLRELVRQGVLIVARDDFGLATRDETLGEAFPGASEDESANPPTSGANQKPAKPPLEVAIDVRSTATWNAQLFGAGRARENAIWKHEATYNFDRPTIYSQLAAQIDSLTPEIAKSMRTAGVAGEAKELNSENKPGPEIEKRLGEMNFVSQFAAVRAAHQAIAEKGPSIDWLGVLVRGYANLSVLTDHFWSSQNEAFAARSLLYAERMMRLSNNQPLAQWHRAYARAILGMSVPALDDVQALTAKDASKSAESGDEAKTAAELPAWTKVIAPYVKFDHQELEKLATAHPELKELVTAQQWILYRSYNHGRWIWEKGKIAAHTCPEDYGIFSVLANWPALKISRAGAAWGNAAFAQFLPTRISGMDDLPSDVKLAADPNDPAAQSTIEAFQRPMHISRELIISGDLEFDREFTWTILGTLIAEEQFVLAADSISAEQDATEHSQTALIDQLMQLVDGHRYAPYIRSYNERTSNKEAMAEILGKIEVRDPTSQMKGMLARGWDIPMNQLKGNALASRAVWAADLTYFGRETSFYGILGGWPTLVNEELQDKLVDSLRAMNPYSPQATRLRLLEREKLETAKLPDAEKRMKDDPVGWMVLADAYWQAGDPIAAKRCYQRSFDISPSYVVASKLAGCFYEEGDKKKWRETLKSYLKFEDLSLSTAQIGQQLAEESIRERNWKEAEAPALEAAQSYSYFGLKLASEVYEGMGDWKKSQFFIAEATRSYPTAAAMAWYGWCKRTGRGDVDAAREFAAKSIADDAKNPSAYQAQRACAYYFLEGDADSAIKRLDFSRCPNEDNWDAVWRIGLTTIAADALKDTDRRSKSIVEWRTLIEKIRATDAPSADLLSKLCTVFEGGKLEQAYLDKIDKALETWPAYSRSYIQYFFGCAFDDQGDKEHAEQYWGRCAFSEPFDCFATTLSGDRLVKLHGLDRGGMPKEYRDQEAKVAKENSESEAQESDSGKEQKTDEAATE